MTLAAVTLAAVTAAVAAVAYAMHLRRKLAALQVEYESEMTWAAEYCRQATQARSELSVLQKRYTALSNAHTRVTVPMISRAWQSGLSNQQQEGQ